jgi:hypothetical protein
VSSAITPEQLVEAVAAFLRERVMPAVDGNLAFEARVSANALDLVARALRQPAEVAEAHAERLALLLGRSGSPEALEAELCERIRTGTLDAQSDAAMAHLRRAAIEALGVDQPRYSALRPGSSG